MNRLGAVAEPRSPPQKPYRQVPADCPDSLANGARTNGFAPGQPYLQSQYTCRCQ